MRKIIIGLMSFILLGSMFSHASSVPSEFKPVLDNFIISLDAKVKNLNLEKQKTTYTYIVNFFTKMQAQASLKTVILIDYLRQAFVAKLEALPVESTTTTNSTTAISSNNTYQLDHVNMDIIRSKWLSRHNAVRDKKGLPRFTREPKLEITARNWALHLVQIGTWTHARKSTDGFYNYNSIKERFANLGVHFNESKGTAFSENIAYEFTSCNQGDCTQSVLGVMKKGFDFFMKEESYNGAHYRAIIQPYFNELGMGIAKAGNKYYIVTHYGIDAH